MPKEECLLSMEALHFLSRCDYQEKNHDERTKLIKVARELYPSEDDWDEED